MNGRSNVGLGLAAALLLTYSNVGWSMPTDQAEFRSANAALGYHVAEHSPLIHNGEKTAISQDFHGVPLNGRARKHRVGAKSVSCRAADSNGLTPNCSIVYAAGASADISGDDAKALWDALETLGADAKPDAGGVMMTLTAIRCTIDDAKAHQAAKGDDIPGFSCRFE